MSSIIASREPPPLPLSTPGTGRGVLSRASMPIDCASRRAGSMVSTTTLRPRSAARSASAADVVVLPTPPEPQQTMMPRLRSSSRASTSRSCLGSWVATSGPTRALARVLRWVGRAGVHPSPSSRSTSARLSPARCCARTRMNAPAPHHHQNTRASARVGPLVAAHEEGRELLDVDALLDDRISASSCAAAPRQTSAEPALALRAAERGRKVVSATTGPAAGAVVLDNTPSQCPACRATSTRSCSTSSAPSTRWCRPALAEAEQVLANPFYVAVSSSFAGARSTWRWRSSASSTPTLGAGRWDLIVVDTPPCRSALGFWTLRSRRRSSSTAGSRSCWPRRGPARLMTAGFGMVTTR